MQLRRSLLALACLGVLVLAGCSSFKEVYHFKATSGDHTNYFRVTVNGWTFMSASQYAAGNYDADAVDALFGELQGAKVRVDSTTLQGHKPRVVETAVTTQSGTSTTTTTTQPSESGETPEAVKLETLTGESLDRKKFVFFLSSNSDFFVNQISTFVTTRDMQQSIVTLILKDDVAALERERLNGRKGDAAAEALATRLRTISAELRAAGVTNGQATTKIVSLLQTLAQNSAVSAGVGGITDVATAKQWLQDHPRAFAEGVNP